MEIGAFSWRRARFPPWTQHTGLNCKSFSVPDSSFLHVNGFLPKSPTVMLPPMTRDCERFIKLHTRHAEGLTQLK